MGLLSSLMGDASEIDIAQLEEELQAITADNETIQMGYKVFRDMFVFTNKRLILIDKQGVTGKKVEYLSIPYKSITKFSVETAGSFDTDSELKIWIGSDPTPLEKELKRGTDVVGIQRTLANSMFG